MSEASEELFAISRFARENAMRGAKRLYNENGVPNAETNTEFAEWAAHVANLFTIAEAVGKAAIREASV